MVKKFFCLLIAAFVLVGCGSSNEETAQKSDVEELVEQAQKQYEQWSNYSVRMTNESDDFVYQYTEVLFDDDVKYYYQSAELTNGGVFIPSINKIAKNGGGFCYLMEENGEVVSRDYSGLDADSVLVEELSKNLIDSLLEYYVSNEETKDFFDKTIEKDGDDQILVITCPDLEAYNAYYHERNKEDDYYSTLEYSAYRIEVTFDQDANLTKYEIDTKYTVDGKSYEYNPNSVYEHDITPTYTVQELETFLQTAKENS